MQAAKTTVPPRASILNMITQIRERKLDMPLLTLWAKRGVIETCFDALSLWRQRAEKVEGEALDTSHYMAEESPEDIAERMSDFFSAIRSI